MKKRLALILVIALAIACMLTSCFGKDEDKKLESIALQDGITLSCTVGSTLNTSNIKVVATYDDDSTEVITADKLTFSAIDTSTVGQKDLTITYEDKTVTVKVNVSLAGGVDITGVSLPETLTARKNYMQNFRDKDNVYVVGDDNAYRFALILEAYDDNFNLISGLTYTGVSTVSLVEGDVVTLLTGAELDKYVVIDEVKHTYDFTEEAVGKTFKITTRPSTHTGAAYTAEQVVKVVDAYNIYDVKELNLITNVREETFGETNQFNQPVVVEEFLADNGIVRPAKLAGVVLHSNLNITPADIPAEYVNTYTNAEGVTKTGIYDQLSIYYHENRIGEETFSMYGNYFTISSKEIPCVGEEGYLDNGDTTSNSQLFKFSVDELVYDYRNTATPDKYKEYDHNDFTTNIVDLALRDDDSNTNEEAASARSKLGVIGIKTNLQVFNFTNVKMDAYFLSLLAEGDHQTLNFNQVDFYNSWQGHIFTWAKNFVWEDNDAEDVDCNDDYQPLTVNVTDSRLAKCGGPVFMLQSDSKEDKSNRLSRSEVYVDEASEIWSYVTGQESWFKAFNQQAIAAQIVAMSGHISNTASQMGTNAAFVKSMDGYEKMNFIVLSMPSGTGLNLNPSASPADLNDVDDKFTIGDKTILNQKDGDNPMVDAYINNVYAMAGQIPPVFQSSEGGTCASNGTDAVFGIETGAMAAPTMESLQGDFVTLYYLGIGIGLEYFH